MPRGIAIRVFNEVARRRSIRFDFVDFLGSRGVQRINHAFQVVVLDHRLRFARYPVRMVVRRSRGRDVATLANLRRRLPGFVQRRLVRRQRLART